MKLAFLILFGLLLLFSPVTWAQWHKHTFEVMGTEAKVELWEPDEVKGKELVNAVVDEMERINQLMSPYIETSELYKINDSAADKSVTISRELFQLLQKSIDFSLKTQGAFDITFASVGYQYDYRNSVAPSDDFIKQSTPLINFKSIQLDARTSSVKFSVEGTRIDLGGIAKGHAVDSCIEILKKAGIKNAFVKAGGDSRLIGDKRGRLWTIGIQHPRKEDAVLTQVPLENVAISTSGDYERFFIRDGERIHHIIDPKTGRSSRESISVSIIAENSTTADALSTSVFIMGFEKGLAMINELKDVSAIIIDNQGKFHYSDDLSER
ncbi:FAD:protein FMN transferase [Pleionea sediminis]|uniref:FAD:protein FMN transferase n=1 Tax=Pleionea sediminis TaxID=2569479 RepID=UPI0011851E46|nr:FAD:protein FMN transferase [Pleionea sediminis]